MYCRRRIRSFDAFKKREKLMITAVVGSGGKTTLIHKLANKYRSQNKKVLVITTTHMLIENDTLVTDDPDEIIARLNETGYVMAGTKATDEKITALSADTYMKICNEADEVLIEADGSKHMPLKFPNETEPVIPVNTDKIIVVTNLCALNHKAVEVVHRLTLATQSLGIGEDTIITPLIIQKHRRNLFRNPLCPPVTCVRGFNPGTSHRSSFGWIKKI